MKISNPFDPNEISIDTKKVTMDVLLRRMRQGTIKLNPDFQRNQVWNEKAKSRLIESLMLNIPIPIFYVAADKKNDWTVVDGLQRISTFRDFLLNKSELHESIRNTLKEKGGSLFRLSGLEFLTELEGKNVKDLESEDIGLYNRILETEFTFTIISPGTSEEVKRNIFKRINTGGEPLTSQEIRNCLYAGAATQLLRYLAKSKSFLKATFNKINGNRMEDQEWILGLLAFTYRSYESFDRNIPIDKWLSDTMEIINGTSIPIDSHSQSSSSGDSMAIKLLDIKEVINLFNLGMERNHSLFGQHSFRASCGGMKRQRLNRRLFETWGILLSQLSQNEFAKLKSNSKAFFQDYEVLLKDPSFKSAISKHGMTPTGVKNRFNFIKNLISKHTK